MSHLRDGAWPRPCNVARGTGTGHGGAVRRRRRATLLVVLAAIACEPRVPVEPDVTFEDERRIDLTGDGLPERVMLDARGPTYDSLHIRLQIRSDADSLLYHDAWSSGRFVENAVGAPPQDTAIQRLVRGHLTEMLKDAAFAPPAIVAGEIHEGGIMPDSEAVRSDIAEYSWRRSAGLPDTVPLPAGARDQIGALLVPDADLTALVGELARQPSFTYAAGHELTNTVAWSHQERRFIRIRSCC
jgi:hypothetical protein